MQYAKSSLYDQVRDFLLTGELYEVTATSGANLRKSRGSREPRGSKLLFPEADPCLFAVGARESLVDRNNRKQCQTYFAAVGACESLVAQNSFICKMAIIAY